jgi:iron(III) transport system ATP-binding protein
MIGGFETPTSGTIMLAGERVNDVTPDKRNTAMVFQSYALFPHYNVFDNIAYGLRNKNISEDKIKDKVMNILRLVELDGLEKRNTNQLSGGQQQRVALARALVMEPLILLFDEPLSNLDAKLRVYMRKEIRKIQQKIGFTSLYVTHDQAEAMNISDQIIIMNKGHMEQMGTPKEIYNHPTTRFVADFIGNANFVPGKIVTINDTVAQVMMLGDTVPIQIEQGKFSVGEEVVVVIRPEVVEIGQEGNIKAQVVSSIFMGSVQEYILKVGENTLNVEQFNPVASTIYQAGDFANIAFCKNGLHIVKGRE